MNEKLIYRIRIHIYNSTGKIVEDSINIDAPPKGIIVETIPKINGYISDFMKGKTIRAVSLLGTYASTVWDFGFKIGDWDCLFNNMETSNDGTFMRMMVNFPCLQDQDYVANRLPAAQMIIITLEYEKPD